MAKPLDNQEEPQRVEYPAEDVEIAFRMATQALNEGNGLQTLGASLQQSQDPAQVVGKFLATLLGQLAENLRDEYGIDPGVFLAKNGVLEKLLDYIEGKLGLPPEFSDQVYNEVLDTIKAAAMAPPAANPQATQPQQPQPQEGY